MLSLPQSIYRSFVSSLKFYIVDTVHPATFELVVCGAFPAYILDEIKPCNLDLVKQFTWITGIYCSECLRSDNAIRNHTNQILRYFDTVCPRSPYKIAYYLCYTLAFISSAFHLSQYNIFKILFQSLYDKSINLPVVGFG